MPQCFAPGAAAATAISCGRVVPESSAGTQSHSSIHDGGLRDGAILTGDVQNLRPEPFAGVNAANKVSSRPTRAYGTDE